MKTWVKAGLALLGLGVIGVVTYGFVDNHSRKNDGDAFDLAYDNIKQISRASKDLPSGIDPMLAIRPEYESIVAKCTWWGQSLANTVFDPGRDKSRLEIKDWDPIASRPAGNDGQLLLVAFETVDKSSGVVACFVSKDGQVHTSRILISDITPR